jgi:hypothetical protein
MGDLQVLSVLLEALIVVLCLAGMFWKKMKFLAGIAVAFAVYALIEVSKIYELGITEAILDSMYFIATFCVLIVVWQFYVGRLAVKPVASAMPETKERKGKR